jgi:hypothetical protein
MSLELTPGAQERLEIESLQQRVRELEETLVVVRGANSMCEWHRDTARLLFVHIIEGQVRNRVPEIPLAPHRVALIVRNSYLYADELLKAEIARQEPQQQENP